jgi:hypothetical protein
MRELATRFGSAKRSSAHGRASRLHARAKAAGLATTDEAGLDGTGAGSFMLTDPDGNPVLVDQHE